MPADGHTAFGDFEYQPQKDAGLVADCVVTQYKAGESTQMADLHGWPAFNAGFAYESLRTGHFGAPYVWNSSEGVSTPRTHSLPRRAVGL